MKTLLIAINAKYIHSNLAVYSLKASAGQWKDEVEIAEYTINHLREDILADIYRRKPDVAAISCYIWNMEYVQSLLKDLKKVLPEVDIWLPGGFLRLRGGPCTGTQRAGNHGRRRGDHLPGTSGLVSRGGQPC